MKVIAAGLPAAFAALVGVEILAALSADYLTDVDYVVDEHVAPDGASPSRGDDEFRLVILGDSTAAGVGSADVGSSLPVQLAHRVARGSGRTVHVTGFGISGARTADVATEQVPLLPETGVDSVVIVIGSNDVTHVTPPWDFARQTRSLVTAARERTGAQVVLGGIPRFAGIGALAQPLRGITDRYAGILRTQQVKAVEGIDGVVFVDIASLASPRFIDRPESMSWDQFHPSEVGYGFWADALAPPIAVRAAQER